MSLSQGNVGVIILATVFSLLAIVAVGLRFQARKLKRSRLGVDDYLILPALVREWCLLEAQRSIFWLTLMRHLRLG